VWLRRLTVIVCLAIPPLVAFGRLYRGMHHLTDIGAAFLNGITCALLTYWWYRADKRQRDSRPVQETSLDHV
jgi:membrane-associated phospholipid phosphatase